MNYNEHAMDAVVDLSWRIYPASLLMAAGLLTALAGWRRELDGIRRSFGDPQKNVTWARGFRRSMLGLALLGTGGAWLSEQLWLLVLTLAICGEELFESTLIIFALTRGRDLRIRIRIPSR